MKFELDKVPTNLDSAVQIICDGLTSDEYEFINIHTPVCLHHSFGRYIRNNWSLWEKDTILVQWFINEYGISHADDISAIILEGVWAKVKREEPNIDKLVNKFKDHWRGLGEDPADV